MAYSTNLLPKTAAYYSFNRATLSGSNLILEEDGYAEISISKQMLPKLTSKMLVVIHPSVFSDYYTNNAVQVNLSIILLNGTKLEYLISASATSSGVFNAEIDLPEEEFISFTYRISSAVEATIYNWELCAEEAVDLTTVIEGVEQELPKLLYDYNVYAYAVEQNEITVGLISCYLLNATDLQGHFTISFFATERCNVHVRIKDNNVTELYTPLVYTVEKGYASISVPHAYLKKMATTHAFSVTIQCTNGQLSIPVRGMLYTIDGGYLATRLLDAGIDIQDISIKQLSTDNAPSEIYAIGFESNRLILKSRAYNYLQRADWLAIKDFGEGITACVEFYGRWAMRSGMVNYTLNTESVPFVFILDLDNTLRAYSGALFDVEHIIDTEVTHISACQGFNSMYDIEQDQGLVIAYVKNGNVYYKQWLYDSNDARYKWMSSPALYEGGDASFVSAHRLPDYRLGICVQTINGTIWYITDRTYVSQAVKPEIANLESRSLMVTTVIDVNKLDTYNTVGTVNEFEEGPLEFNNFSIMFDGPLILIDNATIDDLKKNIRVEVNNTSIPNSIDKILITNNVLTIIFKNAIQGGKTVTVHWNLFALVMQTYNNCWAEIQKIYTWNLPLPTVRHNYDEQANITVIGELDLTVKSLIENKLVYQEVLNTSVEGILDAKVNALITTPHTYNENIHVTTSGELSATVLMTGTAPI